MSIENFIASWAEASDHPEIVRQILVNYMGEPEGRGKLARAFYALLDTVIAGLQGAEGVKLKAVASSADKMAERISMFLSFVPEDELGATDYEQLRVRLEEMRGLRV